jgi:hypothetical protein
MAVRREILELERAGDVVVELLRANVEFAQNELDALGSTIGRLRAEINNWRNRSVGRTR